VGSIVRPARVLARRPACNLQLYGLSEAMPALGGVGVCLMRGTSARRGGVSDGGGGG
jgi:hypothetical protein